MPAKVASAARAKEADASRMPITPGYRSPDVEDGRFDKPPFSAASAAIVERIFPGQVKWNTHDKKPPVDGWEPGWKKHHIPFEGDPVYAPVDTSAPPYNLRDLGIPGGAFDMTPRPPWLIGKPKP